MEMFEYSLAFQQLVESDDSVQLLLEGSCVYEETFADWEEGRRFISSAFDRGGTVLDVGCGNGFLLRCLQEWVPHGLEPYGIDINDDQLHQARSLYPDQAHHFANCEAASFIADRCASTTAIFPHLFDFIFWNVWDNARFTMDEYRRILDGLYCRLEVGGRLILGFYDVRPNNLSRITDLQMLGYRVAGMAEASPHGTMVAWLDLL